MAELAHNSLIVLAAIMLLGGVFGFVKAKSKASLIAGVVSSILLSCCFAVTFSNLRVGLIGGAVVCAVLDGVFFMRVVKTKKFMPAFPLMVISALVLALIICALFTPGGANDVPG